MNSRLEVWELGVDFACLSLTAASGWHPNKHLAVSRTLPAKQTCVWERSKQTLHLHILPLFFPLKTIPMYYPVHMWRVQSSNKSFTVKFPHSKSFLAKHGSIKILVSFTLAERKKKLHNQASSASGVARSSALSWKSSPEPTFSKIYFCDILCIYFGIDLFFQGEYNNKTSAIGLTSCILYRNFRHVRQITHQYTRAHRSSGELGLVTVLSCTILHKI